MRTNLKFRNARSVDGAIVRLAHRAAPAECGRDRHLALRASASPERDVWAACLMRSRISCGGSHASIGFSDVARIMEMKKWCAMLHRLTRACDSIRNRRDGLMASQMSHHCPKGVPECRGVSRNVPKCPPSSIAELAISIYPYRAYADTRPGMSQKRLKSGTFWDISDIWDSAQCFMKHRAQKRPHFVSSSSPAPMRRASLAGAGTRWRDAPMRES